MTVVLHLVGKSKPWMKKGIPVSDLNLHISLTRSQDLNLHISLTKSTEWQWVALDLFKLIQKTQLIAADYLDKVGLNMWNMKGLEELRSMQQININGKRQLSTYAQPVTVNVYIIAWAIMCHHHHHHYSTIWSHQPSKLCLQCSAVLYVAGISKMCI